MAALYVALPVMNEPDTLPLTVQCINDQDFTDFEVVVCVNQPDEWWTDTNPAHLEVCTTNAETLNWLYSLNESRFHIIDKSSKGNGWVGKNHGIGWARKTIFDHIMAKAHDNDLIISLDADTTFSKSYFRSVADNLTYRQQYSGLSVPYYHKLTGDHLIDRSILHYEIYMRSYLISLFLIENPYAFTALGSAICVRLRDVKAIGGMTPKLSGEDFYFLQKLVKYKPLLHWNSEPVFPAARLSDRVFFGTGPALIKGILGNWESYPVYPQALFQNIYATFKLFRQLFEKDIETPLDSFLIRHFGSLPWQGLRDNCKTVDKFEKACCQKIDGLRILQYLKDERNSFSQTDEQLLMELFILLSEKELISVAEIPENVEFAVSGIQRLEYIRNVLYHVELVLRKRHFLQTQCNGL